MVKGHLPDWIAFDNDLNKLMVAEVKGCHPNTGLKETINRAWNQANRVEINYLGNPLPLHRIAIVSRWGFASGKKEIPTKIYVKYSLDENITTNPIQSEIKNHIYLSILRQHVGSLILSVWKRIRKFSI